VFGATNQLLAGLTFLVIIVWLRRLGHKGWFIAIPMVFMFAVTLTSLVMLVVGGGQNSLVQGISVALIVLSLIMIALGLRSSRSQAEVVSLTPGSSRSVASDVLLSPAMWASAVWVDSSIARSASFTISPRSQYDILTVVSSPRQPSLSGGSGDR